MLHQSLINSWSVSLATVCEHSAQAIWNTFARTDSPFDARSSTGMLIVSSCAA